MAFVLWGTIRPCFLKASCASVVWFIAEYAICYIAYTVAHDPSGGIFVTIFCYLCAVTLTLNTLCFCIIGCIVRTVTFFYFATQRIAGCVVCIFGFFNMIGFFRSTRFTLLINTFIGCLVVLITVVFACADFANKIVRFVKLPCGRFCMVIAAKFT